MPNYHKTIPLKILARTAKFLLVTLLAIFICSPSVLAQTTNPYKILQTPFYDSNDCADPTAEASADNCVNDTSTTCPGDNGGALVGDVNAQKAFLYFISKGLTPEQSAGIVGNLIHESGVDPTKQQDGSHDPFTKNGVGFGLAQWTFTARQQPLNDLAKAQGKPVTDLGVQLDFIWQELTGGYRQVLGQLRGAKTVDDAVVIVQGNANNGGPYPGYERPKDEVGSLPDRIAAAKAILTKFGSSVPTTPTTPSAPPETGGCSGGAVPGSIVQTALNYAWATNRGDICDEKPEYKKAIDAAAAAGQYTGANCDTDSTLHGIDCGGFVTRVMIDSGADPGYNYGGKLSAGASNTTGGQIPYLDANSGPGKKYTKLGAVSSTASLKPGDIAINNDHTFIYVGQQPGFADNSASASQGTRAPMARPAYFSNSAGSFTWYRLN